jgi:site-specific recombinase XerD
MSTALFFPDPRIRQRLRVGPLASDIDGFAQQLADEGFAHATAKEKLRFVRDLSRWLEDRGAAVEALDEAAAEAFSRERGRGRRVASTYRDLLRYLREHGRIGSARSDKCVTDPTGQIARAYERFLIEERGLAPVTVTNYCKIIRAFLAERFPGGQVQPGKLGAQDANLFVLRYCQRLSRKRAKLTATALRSFLRFLYQRGDIGIDFATAVLPVMDWRLSGLPKSLTLEQVQSMLATCERETHTGRRDYAILLLMARLGLRAGEVVAMTLDDLDREAGLLIVRGKGQRQEPLPLSHEVGEALVSYLREGRPTCATRRLFVRVKAPYRGFASSVAICDIVKRALARAGIDLPFKGSHLLRHSLATEMLRHGASLKDIGQILRHRHPETTQIYAKVDLSALQDLAPPWPGGAA